MGAVIAVAGTAFAVVLAILLLVAGLKWIAEDRTVKIPPVIRNAALAAGVLIIAAACIAIGAAMNSFLELI